MKIKEITITNFRGIEKLELKQLDSQMNLIVGINGAGKSSILDSAAILLSWLLAKLKTSGTKGKLPLQKDIMIGKKNCTLSLKLGDGTEWSLCQNKAYTIRNAKSQCQTETAQLTRYAQSIVEDVEDGRGTPVIVFYPVERAIATAPVNLHRDAQEPVVWDAYKGALSGNADFRFMFEWYRRQEDAENEQIRDNAEYRDKCLSAVRSAISAFFVGFSEMRVRRRPYQAMVVKKDGLEVEFTQLSQGEKCYLSLVCDIARRLAIANPNLANPLEGDGIVLIDEVDMHLHPKWQSEVASKLMKVFPNCQFFISTHSAQVLSDLRKGQVIPIANGKRLEISFDPFGKLSSQIMTNYFDLEHQRNQDIALDIDNAFLALQSNDRASFARLFDQLKSILGASDRDVIHLMVDAKRKGWL